eukprot:TRINITY_DN68033_c6_g1_i1.p1 TRINITY_DN68033_c6_g1~~TRINITY_DN68033_c6_g1_i1.p1  ORF type:complete len:325 (-),score=-6.97 TRINITY_DN68033_c6_g1_i1:87-1061(-)
MRGVSVNPLRPVPVAEAYPTSSSDLSSEDNFYLLLSPPSTTTLLCCCNPNNNCCSSCCSSSSSWFCCCCCSSWSVQEGIARVIRVWLLSILLKTVKVHEHPRPPAHLLTGQRFYHDGPLDGVFSLTGASPTQDYMQQIANEQALRNHLCWTRGQQWEWLIAMVVLWSCVGVMLATEMGGLSWVLCGLALVLLGSVLALRHSKHYNFLPAGYVIMLGIVDPVAGALLTRRIQARNEIILHVVLWGLFFLMVNGVTVFIWSQLQLQHRKWFFIFHVYMGVMSGIICGVSCNNGMGPLVGGICVTQAINPLRWFVLWRMFAKNERYF